MLHKEDAARVMSNVHYRGIASGGGFTAAVANAKVKQLAELARLTGHVPSRPMHEHPLNKE